MMMMMMNGMVGDECMSNLTSAYNEASNLSSGNIDEQSQPSKRKRNQPGHPDPEAEVIALSPKSLLATNRFVCEVCNKGFQRDQNLQLHRRGHNLPWKLKQRSKDEVIRRKVYVCPEVTCVHHEPSRALGDLTGIKKHFFRKHGEKKWKCEKCSKLYAVQSDWKAHSKICGTKEYKCDCGTIFSRRDGFITHRAFCDALAEESARSISIKSNPLSNSQPSHIQLNLQNQFHGSHNGLPSPIFSLKQEQDLQETFNLKPQQLSNDYDISSNFFMNSNPNVNPMLISSFQQPNSGSRQIAFTEYDSNLRGMHDTPELFRLSNIPTFGEDLTQIARVESESYSRGRSSTPGFFRRSSIPTFGQYSSQFPLSESDYYSRGTTMGNYPELFKRSSIPNMGLTQALAESGSYSEERHGSNLFQCGQSSTYLAPPATSDSYPSGGRSGSTPEPFQSPNYLLHEMMMGSNNFQFEEPTSFNEGTNFSEILSKNYQETLTKKVPKEGGNNEGVTRDFLGLTAFPDSSKGQECLFMADLHQMGSSYEHQN